MFFRLVFMGQYLNYSIYFSHFIGREYWVLKTHKPNILSLFSSPRHTWYSLIIFRVFFLLLVLSPLAWHTLPLSSQPPFPLFLSTNLCLIRFVFRAICSSLRSLVHSIVNPLYLSLCHLLCDSWTRSDLPSSWWVALFLSIFGVWFFVVGL